MRRDRTSKKQEGTGFPRKACPFYGTGNFLFTKSSQDRCMQTYHTRPFFAHIWRGILCRLSRCGVLANFISLIFPQAGKLAHSVARPFPTKTCFAVFAGAPFGLAARSLYPQGARPIRKVALLPTAGLSLRLGLVDRPLCGPVLALASVQAPSQPLASRFYKKTACSAGGFMGTRIWLTPAYSASGSYRSSYGRHCSCAGSRGPRPCQPP